ncbi:SCP2 sterol-binding domain-containing protein [Nocardia sp. NPDC058666]|uniref:SCP2 sterol-binding domain-containing protein n=1 Tax=Nocardia sp. NPDC058666 TaxID=3346587 RepID=UPI00364E1BFC
MTPEITEAQFRELVLRSTDTELVELLDEPVLRRMLFERIFELCCVSVDVAKTAKVDVVVRWAIGSGPDLWDMHVVGGTCAVVPGPSGQRPNVTLTMSDAVFLRLIARQSNGLHLLATGKVRVRGSKHTVMRMDSWFR